MVPPPTPKPRGFWDYALSALVMTGLLAFLFLVDASDAFGWADAAFALTASVFFVLFIILARRAEKATWITKPGWQAHLLAIVGAFTLMFGAVYADAYFLHGKQITSNRLLQDAETAAAVMAGILWSLRRRRSPRCQVL